MKATGASRPLPRFDSVSSTWGRREAAHLLRRAQFGATDAEIDAAAAAGMDSAIDRLLTRRPPSEPFSTTDAVLRRAALDAGSIEALKAWWLHRMLASGEPLVEKLTLLWHNHFATSYAKVQSVELMARQNDLLRRRAIGRFDLLLHEMARDPAMVTWLDGAANRKRSPNENFARELMELFSLGVDGGYTETDVVEAARAFTGWHVREGAFWFDASQHDRGEKEVLGAAGDFDGDDVVRLCLEHAACPRFTALKLLRTFVADDPSPAWIEQVAARVRTHDYDVAAVLRELFAWSEFYGGAAQSAIIKSPVELVVGALHTLEATPHLEAAGQTLADLGHDLFQPPTVKGWEGGRLWINSTAMILRSNFAVELIHGDRYGAIADPARVAGERGWTTPDQAVDYYTELLLDSPPSRDARQALIGEFAASSGDLGRRLRQVIHLSAANPQFQLM